MKVFNFIFLFLLYNLFGFSLSAQTKTLLGDGLQSVSGFGGPVFAISQINGQNALWTGGQGAAVFNERLILGGGGYQMSNETSILKRDVQMGMGGLLLGYIFRPQRQIHLIATVLAGGGGINGGRDNAARFTALMPQLEVEANITNYLRIGLGVGQHFIVGLDDPLYPTDAELSRPMLGLSFRFGAF